MSIPPEQRSQYIWSIIIAAVIGGLIVFALSSASSVRYWYSEWLTDWVDYLSAGTEPATVPIIVVTLLAMFAGTVNAVWASPSSSDNSITVSPSDPPGTKKQQRERLRENRRKDVK